MMIFFSSEIFLIVDLIEKKILYTFCYIEKKNITEYVCFLVKDNGIEVNIRCNVDC